MPGSIKVTVLEVVDLPGDGGKKYAIKVSMGNVAHETNPQAAFGAASGSASIRPFNADFSFPVLNLQHPVTLTLLDIKADEPVPVGKATIAVPSIVEKGFRDEFVNVTNGGRIHVKTTFVLTDEERNKIAAMRKRKAEAAAAAASSNTPPANGPPSPTPGPKPTPATPSPPAPAVSATPISIQTPAPAASAASSSPSPSSAQKGQSNNLASPSSPSPARSSSPVSSSQEKGLSPRRSLENTGSGSGSGSSSGTATPYIPMPPASQYAPRASQPSSKSTAGPPAESTAQGSPPTQSEVDTSPIEQVRIRIKAIEELRKEMEKEPAGSLSREQARERLQTETEALALAEELRRQELRRRGIDPGNITRREAHNHSEMDDDEGVSNPFEDVPLIVKQVAGGVAAVLALVLLWPRGRRRAKPKARGVYVVKRGDRLAGLVPEHYCHPDTNFYALNQEVCESNYIYEGQPLYLP